MNELPFPNYPVTKMSLLGRTLVTLPAFLTDAHFPFPKPRLVLLTFAFRSWQEDLRCTFRAQTKDGCDAILCHTDFSSASNTLVACLLF